MKPTKEEVKMHHLLSLLIVTVRDNWNPNVKGDWELANANTLQEGPRPMFQMSDDLIHKTLQSSLDGMRLSKVARKLATELITIALVQSSAVTKDYEGIKESSIYVSA